MTASSLSALWSVEQLGPVTLGDLAAAERVQPPTITRIVSRLEESGLVAREVDPYTAAREVLGTLGTEPAVGSCDGRSAALDHIGVAVRRIEDRVALYRDLLGLELRGIEQVEGEGVRVAMLPACARTWCRR